MDSTRKPRSGIENKFGSSFVFLGHPIKSSATKAFVDSLMDRVRQLPMPLLRVDWDAMTKEQRTEYLFKNALELQYVSSKIGDETYVEFTRLAIYEKARYDSRGRRYI